MLQSSEQKKYQEALSLVEEQLKKNPDSKEKDLFLFEKAWILFQIQKWPEALEAFQAEAIKTSTLSDYALYLSAICYKEMGDNAKAVSELEKINFRESNIKLQTDVSILLGELSLMNQNFKQAQKYFLTIEKKARGTENYPALIYNLARAEAGLNNHSRQCQWLNKLYTKFPNEEFIKDWGYDLASNNFQGSPTKCSFKENDFRLRIKNLLWSGHDQRAQEEILQFKKNAPESALFLADQLQAQFYIQEGETQKAFDLLKTHLESQKNNFEYLMNFAVAASRVGEAHIAIGLYERAYKLAPNSRKGLNALYQAAFSSYQFQDYDGASRKFFQFIKKGSGSSLAREAQWYVSWLKYLRGDYQGAYSSLHSLQAKIKGRRKSGGVAQDRIRYWMAMSLLKMGQVKKSYEEFKQLSKDQLIGYYSLAAKARLKKIDLENPPERELQESQKVLTRFEPPEAPEVKPTEEDLASKETRSDEEPEETASAEVADVENDNSVDENEKENKIEFKSASLMSRFQQARDLMIVGLDDWAKWDLYEIERRTLSKEHLKILMSEYENLEYYHRSTAISVNHFSSLRAQHGIEGVRYIWEQTYPRAYLSPVEKASREFSIPKELIWGIMRTESSYKKDAISPVGAMGLMQVMPVTGQKVSVLLGDDSFEAKNLLRPEVGIRVGSKYLQRLMKNFENRIPLVAAGYNAGPHRVKAWLYNFGDLSMDEFIEHIPFLETRNYVKKVVSSTQIYSSLYNSNQDFFPYLADPIPYTPTERAPAKETWEEI